MSENTEQVSKDTTTVEDLMGDAPDMGAEDPQALFMEAVENDNNPYTEEVDSHEEGMQAPEGDGYEEADSDAEEGQQEEGQVDDGEVTVSRDAYERIMAMLGLEEGDLEAAAAPAPAEEAKPEVLTPPVQPLAAFKLPETADELLDKLTDPEQYAQHIGSLIQHAVERTIAAMDPIIHERAGYVYQAIEFDKKFFEKHPEVPVPLAIKGLATAQKKLGANASWDDLFAETEKNCAFAMNVAKSVKNANGRTKANAGRYSPQTTRRSRPSIDGPKASPTDEVMSKIMSPKEYEPQALQLLRDVGVM
jgi:hypothetical protein